MSGKIRIGISGWRYPPWRGHFYPPGLVQSRELAHASRQFPTIELNGSFYGLQRPTSYARWALETPPGFVFAIKGHREITHELRLKGIGPALASFMASGLYGLGGKLGPLLWQFPPGMAYEPALFEDFFSLLPRTVPPGGHGLRHAVEVRHASFASPGFIAQLRHHGVAWVVADAPMPWPQYQDVTADFVYVRLHGTERLYHGSYTGAQLDRWAERIRAWADGGQAGGARLVAPDAPAPCQPRDVYCYFDNTASQHAPGNARELAAKLGLAENGENGVQGDAGIILG